MTRGVMYGLTAAALFGASTPFAKTILNDVHPIVLAGLLYAGSGLGLIAVHTVRVAFGQKATAIALPSHRDWGWLAVAIVVGGILGPVLLMFGLAATAASTTSLLLNLESAFTALLAWFLFRENFDRRIAAGMAAILGGGIILSVGPGDIGGVSRGALLVAAACLCWALDNNLTRKVSASDPIVIAALKGLVAGAVNLSLAASLGYAMPRAGAIGFLRLRPELGVVCPRAERPGDREDRGLFRSGSVLRRCPSGGLLRRRRHLATLHCRGTHGHRCLVASERASRT